MSELPWWRPTLTHGLELLTIGEITAVLVLLLTPTTLHTPVTGWTVVSVVEISVLSYEIPSIAYSTLLWLSATPTTRTVARRRIIHALIIIPLVVIIHVSMH